MVSEIKYRYDFIGLSTDDKPTPTTSNEVVDGSTFYASDTSKLYVWYNNQWYEKESTGGTTYTAGDGIDINNNTISVDTTEIQPKLTAGTGIDITDNTISATGGASPTVVQTTGSSTTDVMSQKAITDTIFADGATASKVRIGNTGSVGPNSVSIGKTNTAAGSSGVAIGNIVNGGNKACNVAIGYNSGIDNVNGFQIVIGSNSYGRAEYDVVIGGGAKVESSSGIALGRDATVDGTNCQYSVALGAGSKVSRAGEIGVGGLVGSTWGYNNSPYKIIGGVHDGQLAHDAVTVGQINNLIDAINTALSTNIPHIGA